MEELNSYLEERKVKDVFKELMEQICLEKPSNVHAFIVAYIQEHHADKLAGAEMVKYEDDEEVVDEQNDTVPEIETARKPNQNRRRRSAVSAESVDPANLKNVPKQIIEKTPEERTNIQELIGKVFLFASLDDAEAINDLVNAMVFKQFQAGDVLMTQGDDGDFFYIVDQGEAHIFVKAAGEEKLVKQCGRGDSFGELALMYNAPRAATVKAVTELKTWAVDRQTFKLTLMESTIKKRNRYEMFLNSVPILESLNKWEKLNVADALVSRQFKAGDIVVKQGDHGEEFYIIEKGAVEYTQKSDTGEDVVVGEAQMGDYFGEISLLTSQTRQATVRCTADCTLLVLNRKTFVRVMGPLDNILKRNFNKYKTWMERKAEQAK